MPISPSDRDLAEIAAAVRLDGTLSALAGLATVGGTYMLGMLVNGMTVYGRTCSPGDVFARIDEENAGMIARGRAHDADSWPAEVAEKVDRVWTSDFEQDEREHRALIERNEDTHFDDMTEEDIRAAIEDRAAILTLADATVFPPGSAHFEIPVLRIRLAQVAGWWLVPTDAEGKASISHPSVG